MRYASTSDRVTASMVRPFVPTHAMKWLMVFASLRRVASENPRWAFLWARNSAINGDTCASLWQVGDQAGTDTPLAFRKEEYENNALRDEAFIAGVGSRPDLHAHHPAQSRADSDVSFVTLISWSAQYCQ